MIAVALLSVVSVRRPDRSAPVCFSYRGRVGLRFENEKERYQQDSKQSMNGNADGEEKSKPLLFHRFMLSNLLALFRSRLRERESAAARRSLRYDSSDSLHTCALPSALLHHRYSRSGFERYRHQGCRLLVLRAVLARRENPVHVTFRRPTGSNAWSHGLFSLEVYTRPCYL